MTVPWMMNCSHCDEGWCLDCTSELGHKLWSEEERSARLFDELDEARGFLAAKDAEIERLRGQILLEQDRVKTLKEERDHLNEVVVSFGRIDRHLDAWEGGEG